METYCERLERECQVTENKYPDVKKIVDEVLRINRMSNMDFDCKIERKHLMYEAVKEILKYV